LKSNPIEIVIGEFGWVFVGRLAIERGYTCLEQASVIRSWGTTKGLGEIALNGPTDSTKLDACGSVRLLESKVVAVMACNQVAWRKYVD